MSLSTPAGTFRFRFRDVTVDPLINMVSRGQTSVRIEPKAMGVLQHLARHAGDVVLRLDLLDAVWGAQGGSDETLSRAVSLCRQAFARLGVEDPIRTVPRSGYVFEPRIIRKGGPSDSVHDTSREAMAAYLDGKTRAARIAAPGELAKAIESLERATHLDPGFAPGWAALAQAQAIAAGHTPFGDRLGRIREAGRNAVTALELDQDQHLAHSVRSQVLLAERDVCAAIDMAKKARSLAPEDAEAAMWVGHIFSLLGLFELATPYLETAVALDPLQGRRHMVLAVNYVASGDSKAAERAALQAIELGFFGGHEPYAAAAFIDGKPKLAVERFHDALEDFSRIYSREPRFRPLLELAARGAYGESVMCRHLLLSAAVPVTAFWKGSPEGILSYIFLRTGSAHRFFSSFGTRILPGNSIILPYLWDGTACTKVIIGAPQFCTFAAQIGFSEAWQRFGYPKALEV